MSSSPGFMASIDDYYLVADGATTLGVIETSINIDKLSAYKHVKAQSVLCWIRSMAANWMATDSPSWATIFSKSASGTYNNQWLILDVTKAQGQLSQRKDLAEDTFWVLEEVPGLVHAEDQSAHLNKIGYWPSFNVIYYPQTRKAAGARGQYKDAERYKIFAEFQGNVTSEPAMRRIIAWNDYQDDPLRIAHSPSDAIMARGDLSSLPEERRAGGGIDAKYSSVSLASQGLATFGRAGPTNDNQPTFCWTPAFEATPHAGHPHCFDFEWDSFKPQA